MLHVTDPSHTGGGGWLIDTGDKRVSERSRQSRREKRKGTLLLCCSRAGLVTFRFNSDFYLSLSDQTPFILDGYFDACPSTFPHPSLSSLAASLTPYPSPAVLLTLPPGSLPQSQSQSVPSGISFLRIIQHHKCNCPHYFISMQPAIRLWTSTISLSDGK